MSNSMFTAPNIVWRISFSLNPLKQGRSLLDLTATAKVKSLALKTEAQIFMNNIIFNKKKTLQTTHRASISIT